MKGQHEEIIALQEALQSSPDNIALLKLIINKMIVFSEYDQELEVYIQRALRLDPSNIQLKEKLINLYFRQGKISTCIVICEEIGNIQQLGLYTRTNLAKCYLREDNFQEAKSIYQSIIAVDNDYQDGELDEAFRLIMKKPNDEILDNIDSKILSKPDINFEDVGGMENVKREIDLKIIKPLENIELYSSYGKKVGGGILLYGPPGCGKTFIARATAGQINSNFINITLNDILDMWIGQSEKNLTSYFNLARRKNPCVIFFDEVDALGAKRSDMRQSAGKNVINQFLAEMDGIETNNDGLLIIGATNTPWHLDSAFLRPGRFDRVIFVPPPGTSSKEAILKLKLKDKPQDKIDYTKVAKNTPMYSGADINAIIDLAVENIIEEALKSGTPRPIETKDLMQATQIHKASTTEWFTTAKNYAMFANKSGLYDDILKYIK